MPDAILILGAAVHANGASPALRRRTLHAATLWQEGRAPLVIPCGGTGQHPPAEAQVMQDLLQAAGIPGTAIRCESQSTTTFENIRNALPLLPGPDVIIVTDRYHRYRTAMVARHLGLRATIAVRYR